MHSLTVSAIPPAKSIEELSSMLDTQERHPLDNVPWPSLYPYKPGVSFSIAYAGSHLYLKFYAIEKELKALYSRHQDPVYKDSCVEFFINFEGENSYYNLEVNSRGVCLMAYGPDRHSRQPIDVQLLSTIKSLSRIEASQQAVSWDITLELPLTIFSSTAIDTLKGKSCKANFYKCGDDLLEPHYISWSPIHTEQPDFHLSKFFGNLQFN